jgi:hypothetical protein
MGVAGCKDSISRRLPGGRWTALKAEEVLCDPRRREMENHFECLWSLFRSIPSLEIEGASGFCPRNAGGGALVS